jgi:hypothetical protein
MVESERPDDCDEKPSDPDRKKFATNFTVFTEKSRETLAFAKTFAP